MIVTAMTEPSDPLKRGFRHHVGEGTLEDGTPVHLSMTEHHLYLSVDTDGGRLEERMDLSMFVDDWATRILEVRSL